MHGLVAREILLINQYILGSVYTLEAVDGVTVNTVGTMQSDQISRNGIGRGLNPLPMPFRLTWSDCILPCEFTETHYSL